MRKITLFLLMAVCVVVLLTTEPCEGKKNNDVVEGEQVEESDGNKSVGRGKHNRDRRPGLDDEQPGKGGEQGNGKGHGRRNRQNGKGKNKNKPNGSSESSGSEE
ncbi:uncharacterized protein [Chelonus insularis]|uniref:uncharacterized protein n=1 Tax=Chelonus insularis TaxID=460826 RepID=UPI00158EADD8|nr:uncharacterized protein LOC118074494 [Chelonus insularis]